MGFRLVGTVHDAAVELTLDRERSLLGSSHECDLHLDHPTVSRRHAEVVRGAEVEIRDLGSRNGTFIDGVRVQHGHVAVGARIRFGEVELRLEAVEEADREAAVAFELPPEPPRLYPPIDHPTVDLNPYEDFARHTLPSVLRMTVEEAEPIRIAQAVGAGLRSALPGTVASVEITAAHGRGQGVLFQTHESARPMDDAVEVVRENSDLKVAATFTSAATAQVLAPLVDLAATLLQLAFQSVPDSPSEEEPGAPAEPEPPTAASEVQRIYREAALVARSNVGILVCGESGTGKEVLARYIHRASPRFSGPFVAVNCAALPRDLLEAELFGIEKGVATGVERRQGKFELADSGTLFLDEIGDMGLETQAMILRVLQEGEVYRIGAASPRQVDVRVLAATNRDVAQLLTEGRFREDLYYRIASWVVHLPALRQRRQDIANLAAFFLGREARRQGRAVAGISRAALEALVAYDWPGNIRQLENEMTRAVVFVPHRGLLDRTRLSPDILAGPTTAAGADLATKLQSFERREIARVLGLVGGDTLQAAEILGLPRSTLYRRMKVLGLEPSSR